MTKSHMDNNHDYEQLLTRNIMRLVDEMRAENACVPCFISQYVASLLLTVLGNTGNCAITEERLAPFIGDIIADAAYMMNGGAEFTTDKELRKKLNQTLN